MKTGEHVPGEWRGWGIEMKPRAMGKHGGEPPYPLTYYNRMAGKPVFGLADDKKKFCRFIILAHRIKEHLLWLKVAGGFACGNKIFCRLFNRVSLSVAAAGTERESICFGLKIAGGFACSLAKFRRSISRISLSLDTAGTERESICFGLKIAGGFACSLARFRRSINRV